MSTSLRPRGRNFGEAHPRAAAGAAVDLEGVHQAPGADDAHAHAGRRDVVALEDVGQAGDARALVDERGGERALVALALEREAQCAAAAVGHRVARDLRDRGGDARLVLAVEAQHGRERARALAGVDHVLLGPERGGQDRLHAHAALLSTSTVASSRLRPASR